MMRKPVLFVLIALAICTGGNAFYYGANPYHRHARKHYRRTAVPNYRQRQRHHLRREHPYAQEKIKDLNDRFEVYIPCRRYCRYYQARIKPVVGQYQQNVEVTGPRYRKSWKIPENVDIDGITQSTLPSGYLKLDIPKMHEQVKNSPSNEAPPRDATKEFETAKYAAYTNEHRWSHHRSISEGSPKQEKDQYRAPQRSEDTYFYPNSDGIEILDVEDDEIENELYLKDQKASIGFWNSRGKFQYY